MWDWGLKGEKRKIIGRGTRGPAKKPGLLLNTQYLKWIEILCFTFQSHWYHQNIMGEFIPRLRVWVTVFNSRSFPKLLYTDQKCAKSSLVFLSLVACALWHPELQVFSLSEKKVLPWVRGSLDHQKQASWSRTLKGLSDLTLQRKARICCWWTT